MRTDEQWRWLANTLTVEMLKELLPETAELPVTRHLLPNLRAVNFVIEEILGQGVAYQARFDPQAKGLGEWLRSRHVDIPERLLVNIWTTPERDQLRKTVRSFAEREILPHVDEWERIGELPRELAPARGRGRAAGGELPRGGRRRGRRRRRRGGRSAKSCTRPVSPAACSRRCSPAASRCRT